MLLRAPHTRRLTSSGGGSGMSTGAIVGIAVGAAVVLGALAYFFLRRRNKTHEVRTGKRVVEDAYVDAGRKSPAANIPGPDRRPYHSNTGALPVADHRTDSDMTSSTDLYGLTASTHDNLTSGYLLDSLTISGKSIRSGSRLQLYDKDEDDFKHESEALREFLTDPAVLARRIPYEDLTILRLLSKGSYGEVFLGQLETRHVAIKKLLPEKKNITRSLEQFAGEIEMMSILEHRNIVSYIGVSWDYVQNMSAVVEYMDSGDLCEVLAKNRDRFTWRKEKMSISMDVAEGLVYLHSLRPVVIHRDLKSKNVLLSKRGTAKLSDFGVSRKTSVNETMTSGVGTLLWTAPEIIEGKKYSEKADIFSLGVVLSEIDTCQEPYASMKNEIGERMPGMQLVQMVRLGKLKVAFRDDCPPRLRELAEKCTSLDPDQRPTSMEVAYTLKSIIAPMVQSADEEAACQP